MPVVASVIHCGMSNDVRVDEHAHVIPIRPGLARIAAEHDHAIADGVVAGGVSVAHVAGRQLQPLGSSAQAVGVGQHPHVAEAAARPDASAVDDQAVGRGVVDGGVHEPRLRRGPGFGVSWTQLGVPVSPDACSSTHTSPNAWAGLLRPRRQTGSSGR